MEELAPADFIVASCHLLKGTDMGQRVVRLVIHTNPLWSKYSLIQNANSGLV